VKEIKGIWLPDTDEHFQAHLEKGPLVDGKGTYQLKKIQAALSSVPGDHRKLAVDVGGHVGLWSRVLAKYFDKVVAYEPVPDLAECFLKNVPDNVELRQKALGVIRCNLPLTVCSDNSGNTHAVAHGVKNDGALVVSCERLDAQEFPAPIDFLKIDVEGYEYSVLQGGEETIKRDKPIIVVEQKPGHAERYGLLRTAAVSWLEDFDYVRMWEISGDFCLMHKSQVPK
jgi:FkbM family methyltransferase